MDMPRAKWKIYPANDELPDDVKNLAKQIENDGGTVLTIYQEPYGKNWQIFALLPLEKVKPTPFQRDLSSSHVKRLQEVIEQVKRFIDPIVAVRYGDGEYWTPNGNHRREALLQLVAKEIPAIIIPDMSVAFHILSLNTEKAHNLKEKALEVIRMYRGLLETNGKISEMDYAFQFEEAYLITLGLIYEKHLKFSGSAYVPILKKVDNFIDAPLPEALSEREKRADLLKEVDDVIEPIVHSLRERGINHPFLKQAVVSKVNPIKRKRIATVEYNDLFKQMKKALEKLDPSTITMEELIALASEMSGWTD
ncbi:ParB N-terminal domain-containing protein [Candidatus Kryptobacter tengchongensis]|uniref:Chromosome partitioning protein, ParB family n=1 Tax=Kryptobacter tengchongensis TaxID=1643429 RepID=A0A656D7H1_KRYT1|nr:ParB N-terminal domain-containing protein [Candidatus Kryptobacter tengchongensis]CUT00369.1 chromosome partitioning protein, ParB family [Candidatus Kryptobacter tengchongensis]